jgi:precorrin-3B C17-methyltransferase
MTPQAVAAITRADTLCGYTVYIELVRKALGDRLRKDLTILTTPMRQELERCRLAMEAAASGSDVAMVCGGDAGIYGMAGPLLAMADDYPDVQIEIIPGLTAAVAGAAVLGAPLMNDFCVISLSDLMTPWQVILPRATDFRFL